MNTDLTQIAAHIPADQRPKLVTEALALQEAADALLETTLNATPVDLTSAQTPKDVPAVHAAALAFERDHEASVEIARRLAKIAAERVDSAWFNSSVEIDARLAKEFDVAADALLAALATLPEGAAPATFAGEHWNLAARPLRDALATLNHLHHLRDAAAATWGIGQDMFSVPYELDSRTLYFDSAKAHQAFRVAANRAGRDGYYLAAAATPGVRIVWQTSAQQAEQPLVARTAAHRAEARR